jgi:hypothetical protein
MNTLLRLRGLLTLALPGLLAACGGGGSDGASTAPVGTKAHITGVAAVGAPAASSPVYLKDAAGTALSTLTDGSGNFSFDVSALQPPFMLRVQLPDGTLLYSAALAASADGKVVSGIANINPLSNLILGNLSNAIAGIGPDPNALFQGFATFSGYLTSGRIDHATAAVYGALSPAFKAQLGTTGTDFSPIYGAYQIHDVLDQTFDKWAIYYDAQSGDFQEKDKSLITIKAFGPLGQPSDLSASAGRYGAQVTVSTTSGSTTTNVTLPVTMLIDNAGRLFIAFGSSYAAIGSLSTTGDVTGHWYTLDAFGNATSSSSDLSGSTIATTTMDKTQLLVSLQNLPPGVSLPAFSVTSDVNATYGNNLRAGAAQYQFDFFGPYSVGNGSGARFGSNANSRTLYFYDAAISSTQNTGCHAADSWSFDLADLELSLYKVTLTETVSAASSSATCGFASEDAVGTAMFTGTGLLVFYTDAATASDNAAAHGFVSVKRFAPN